MHAEIQRHAELGVGVPFFQMHAEIQMHAELDVGESEFHCALYCPSMLLQAFVSFFHRHQMFADVLFVVGGVSGQ